VHRDRGGAAPRGTFILDRTQAPVLLITAGIGATPALAMLHALAEGHSEREIWWLHGARSSRDHSFAAEARALLASLLNVHTHVCYSRPGPDDLVGPDFDSAGRLAMTRAPGGKAGTDPPSVSCDTRRLEAFSDAVFAITITLLVLAIRPPTDDRNLVHGLVALWPSYLAYAITFLFIGQVWANHHVKFDHIRAADRVVLLLNTLLLMVVAFLPFATSVLAGHKRSDQGNERLGGP
jgi:hypothetical protein